MTIPYRMPNINSKGMYTTIIPLSSMKSYEFECNSEEVNLMVTKNLVAKIVSSRCINVVYTEPLKMVPRPTVEVTFDLAPREHSRFVRIDGLCPCSVQGFENRPFGMHLSNPYLMFLINSVLDYEVKEDDV